MGGNLQVNFKKEEKPTFVYSFQAGTDFLLAKSGFELGLAVQDGNKAFQYGVHLHGLLPTVSYRSAKGLNQSYVGVGVRADFLPLPLVVALSGGVDGRPLRTERGFAENPTPSKTHLEKSSHSNIWLSAAHAEWASIQAFEDLVHQLLCCEAPKSLIKRAKKSMEDEFRHTVLCAGIASKMTGQSTFLPEIQEESRTPLAGPEGLIRLALESWFDGCINEGLAAERLKYRAETEQDEDALSVLHEIVHDEMEHAQLAWDILHWSIESGGERVEKALRQVMDVKPEYVQKDWEKEYFLSAQERLRLLLSA